VLGYGKGNLVADHPSKISKLRVTGGGNLRSLYSEIRNLSAKNSMSTVLEVNGIYQFVKSCYNGKAKRVMGLAKPYLRKC
jgi:hypothetical protein